MSQPPKVVQVAVVGVSGGELARGPFGVGKSLLCNRFVRGAFDEFFTDHCSVLSQTDFGGSPVINNENWLYWGDRTVTLEENLDVVVRVIEQTEFRDDETYEPIASSSKEDYCRRAVKVNLSSRDKLMYIRKEQLGLEADFPQQVLPDGKFSVDVFIVVCDVSHTSNDVVETKLKLTSSLLTAVLKTKKPVIAVLAKFDKVDDEMRKQTMAFVVRKDFKNCFFPPIEVSSTRNVNVEETFQIAAVLALKHKLKRKMVLSFNEAAYFVDDRRKLVKSNYVKLLKVAMPVRNWPTQRFSWNRLLADLNRQPDFNDFVRVFGVNAAYDLYMQYVCEAREHWMSAKLKSFIPQLPRVFKLLLEKEVIDGLDWNAAIDKIYSHALFDEFFQSMGSLGKQLDPLTPKENVLNSHGDTRIPAEILIRPEAREAFETIKKEVHAVKRREELEENFEVLLSETKQVTPGQPLRDVCIFLQGFPAFENLSPNQASAVYDRYQHELLKRAECDFTECLLEFVELFLEILKTSHFGPLTNESMSLIKDALEPDMRYKLLSRVYELRDELILQIYNFWRQPCTSRCSMGIRCIDCLMFDSLQRFFHRRNDKNYTHLLDVVVHGETSMVAQFITEINSFLRYEPFPSSCGASIIRCFGSEEVEDCQDRYTNMYLIDSLTSLDDIREKEQQQTNNVAAIFVVVCDPSTYDLIPVLQQQGAKLAAEFGGSFFGVGTSNIEGNVSPSFSSNCSSLISREQFMGICDVVCSSQLTRKKRDLRVEVSLMCGDPFATDAIVGGVFGNVEQIASFWPIVHPNLINVGLVPVDVNKTDADGQNVSMRVDFSFNSFHSWLTSNRSSVVHGHIFVYSTRRVSSFAHARAAIGRVLDEGWKDVSGRNVLLVAVVENSDASSFDNNILLNEGSELCNSIGAHFLTVSPCDVFTGEVEKFVWSLRPMVFPPPFDEFESPRTHCSPNKNDRHSTGSEHVRPTTLNLPTLATQGNGRGEQRIKSFSANCASHAEHLRHEIRPTILKSFKPERRGVVKLSTFSLQIPEAHSNQPAPLATPEMVEIAPEYSLVNDALSCDEHIYETLDFSTANPRACNLEGAPKKLSVFGRAHKKKTAELPALLASANPEDVAETTSKEYVACKNLGKSISRRAQTSTLEPSRLHRTAHMLHDSKPKTHTFRQEAMTRSATVAVLNRADISQAAPDVVAVDSVVAAAPLGNRQRQSFSAESLTDAMHSEKKSKRRDFSGNRFVRKVATSFRFKKEKLEEKREEGRKSEGGVKDADKCDRETIATRSLPQSPQIDRKQAKKYASLNATERVTDALSWLSSRSPKRSHKSATIDFPSSLTSSTTSCSTQGVIGSDDTLESLCVDGNGIPVFVVKCVEFIENNNGLEMEGLYRVPGNQAHLSDIERVFRETGKVDFSCFDVPVHGAATALKSFFSCLPAPLIPVALHNAIVNTAFLDDEKKLENLKKIFDGVPQCNREVMRYMLIHLKKVSQSPKTAMDVTNLCKVWFPTIFRPAFTSYEALSAGSFLYQKSMEAIFRNAESLLS